MGEGVASIADVNGDGRREIVLSRPDHPSLSSNGTVEMYTSTDSFAPHAWRTVGVAGGAELGEALAAVDDFDGDGIEEIVTVESIAAPGAGAASTLRVRVLSGATGLGLLHRDLDGEAYTGDLHEVEMCSLSDLDGDGVREVALVSPLASPAGGGMATPVLRVLSGSTLEVLQAWTSGQAPFGAATAEHVEVSSIGDMDGDGVDDILVGAPDAGAGGTVYVLPGKPSIGVQLCEQAASNSTGRVAHVSLVGQRSVHQNDITLVVSDLPSGTFALPLAAKAGGSFPMAGGSQGTLCLDGTIVRLQRYLDASSGAGTFSAKIDLGTWASDFAVPPVAAGERWHFQVWFRDTGPQGATSNFSNSRVVLLQ